MANKLMMTKAKANPAPLTVGRSVTSLDSYEAKDALHTLKRAEEIMRNKPLMRAVKACAKQEMKALAKVAAGVKRK